MSENESHEVQLSEMQSPASGEEQLHLTVQAGDQPPGTQLCRKEPEHPGGRQGDLDPAI